MVKLYIDTRDNKCVIARLDLNGELFEEQSSSPNMRPESIINLIDKVCKNAKIDINKVDNITVEKGPGSYTGLKVGVSVANALSFALGKKVNSIEIGEQVLPKYE